MIFWLGIILMIVVTVMEKKKKSYCNENEILSDDSELKDLKNKIIGKTVTNIERCQRVINKYNADYQIIDEKHQKLETKLLFCDSSLEKCEKIKNYLLFGIQKLQKKFRRADDKYEKIKQLLEKHDDPELYEKIKKADLQKNESLDCMQKVHKLLRFYGKNKVMVAFIKSKIENQIMIYQEEKNELEIVIARLDKKKDKLSDNTYNLDVGDKYLLKKIDKLEYQLLKKSKMIDKIHEKFYE